MPKLFEGPGFDKELTRFESSMVSPPATPRNKINLQLPIQKIILGHLYYIFCIKSNFGQWIDLPTRPSLSSSPG